MTNEHDETTVNECDETTIIFVVRNYNFFVWFQCSQRANSLVG